MFLWKESKNTRMHFQKQQHTDIELKHSAHDVSYRFVKGATCRCSPTLYSLFPGDPHMMGFTCCANTFPYLKGNCIGILSTLQGSDLHLKMAMSIWLEVSTVRISGNPPEIWLYSLWICPQFPHWVAPAGHLQLICQFMLSVF